MDELGQQHGILAPGDAHGDAVPRLDQTVQPDGPVKVVLNVPDYMSLDNLKLAYVDEYAGTYEEIPIEIDYENRTVTAYLTHFSIYALYNEVETPELPYLPGDINGDGAVNNKDVVYLFRYVSGDLEDSEVVELALDFNGDGKVNNRDVTRLFWYVSGKIRYKNNNTSGTEM